MPISKGDSVIVRTAHGTRVPTVAMSGIERGRDFPIIWVCTPEDFARDGFERSASWRPWPVEDVQPDTELAESLLREERDET